MKKVSVITTHRVYNYGAVLQAYATQRVLEAAGMRCELVDYTPPHSAWRALLREYPAALADRPVARLAYRAAKGPSLALKALTFGRFVRRHLALSPVRYAANADILRRPPRADIYMTGSDQVWNSQFARAVDPSYYLNYAPPGAPRVAFASSFGRGQLDAREAGQVQPMLSRYARISVREDEGVQILARMGLAGEALIDPTMQLTRAQWMALAAPRRVRPRYLLLFLLDHEDGGATQYARETARRMGLRLVKLSWEIKRPAGVDRLFTHRGPRTFLSLLAHADFVVTNSFHGVAFSINLNRPFAFAPRRALNGRIESLLRLTGLEDRRMACDPAHRAIDYARVNAILRRERARARRFLRAVRQA